MKLIITFVGYIIVVLIGVVFANQEQAACTFDTAIDDGFVFVNNSAHYAVDFFMEYGLDGERKIELNEKFPPGATKTLTIPHTATNISLSLQYRRIPNQLSIALSETFCQATKKCYCVSGNLLNPKFERVSCIVVENQLYS